ncbi:MAG: hypothetical protein U0414_03295 [Polyangiaceae bacterium]
MKLGRATFLGVRGVADATHEFIHPTTGVPHSVVVFTGPPASGKTRVLEAILAGKEGAAPYATPVAPERWQRTPGDAAKIILLWWLSEDERRAAGVDDTWATTEVIFASEGLRVDADDGVLALLERYEHRADHGKLEYFPANRQLLPYGAAHGLGAAEQRLYRASKDERKYSFVPRFLGTLRQDARRAVAFAERLALLAPTLRFDPERGREAWHVLESSGAGSNGNTRDVTELSASEIDAVIFAATAVNIELASSILLVDRPELHAHPMHAAGLLAGLAALGPDNQLILSTSSPEILGAVDPSAIRGLGPR